MSAPTPAPGDETPREGYYPDPSIPGYVRYWNGAAWVPGTSRPAPTDGALLHTPEPTVPAAPVPAAAPPVEETGPVFFDEEEPPRSELPAPSSPHGNRPEPAASWGASPGLQSGFGGDQDRKVSWGAPSVPDPRAATAPAAPPAPATGSAAPAAPAAPKFPDAAGREDAGPDAPARGEVTRGVPGDHGTMTFHRAPRTHAPPGTPTPPAPVSPGPVPHQQGPVRLPPQPAPADPAPAPVVPAQSAPSSPPPAAPAPALPAPAPPVAAPPAPAAPAAPAAPVQHGTPELPAQVPPGPGAGQPSWAQQVHRLAQSAPAAPATGDEGRGEGPVIPFKPPVSDPFLAVAQAQAAARPAGLGRRLLARLVDTAVIAAVTGAAAVPLGIRAADHVDEKIEAAKLSGRTVTVWLVDGTTAGYLGAVVAVLLLTGIVYEVLPTAKWGRTAGKRLFGLRVQDIGAHEAPSFGAALRRFLVLTVPGLLAVGALGVLWAVFDRPWRQGWHDKAARTFVAR
ncbi:RDD family protein [Streptomyces sp. NPDC127068]|uniref:RDD family protein n=1 Tax=Streptomyces sp. NPDC127068 TaxID=3347127 RepID=UPI003668BB65